MDHVHEYYTEKCPENGIETRANIRTRPYQTSVEPRSLKSWRQIFQDHNDEPPRVYSSCCYKVELLEHILEILIGDYSCNLHLHLIRRTVTRLLITIRASRTTTMMTMTAQGKPVLIPMSCSVLQYGIP
ncbi:hypothetical protein Moror_11429 [Moniliophthora roreri MCA 2997]|uniref:Uncharacterized protein n=1 Tax=Moniliophthora roreri (strain MCA 2997) TaxID=1381753 RepID=V2WRD7_MONRO|nr:hypothetical protein Moror_11429 [Moniliophthora roreri MCA 2997]